MFKLTPELSQKASNNDPFWAVRCQGGKMIIAGQHGSMEVPGIGIRLGQRFFNTPQNVIVREGEMEEYKKVRHALLAATERVGKAAGKVISYSQLAKRKNPRKRR
jgi:hypothetical protein